MSTTTTTPPSSANVDTSLASNSLVLVTPATDDAINTVPALVVATDTTTDLGGAPNAGVLDLTGTTQTVEDSHIGASTRKNYIRTLVDFMIFMFDSNIYCSLLIDHEELENAHALDMVMPVRRRRSRKKLKLMCAAQLKKMTRVLHNSPVRLSGDNSLNYGHIAAFMNTKSKVIKVDADIAKRIAEEEGTVFNTDQVNIDGMVDVSIRLGDSSYSAVQSAISFLFRQSGVERSEAVKGGVSLYCKGSKRKGRKIKQDLGLEISEGKKHMTKAVYSYLADKFFNSKEPEHIFAHLFLVLDW